MHHRDLSRGPAETKQCDPEPDGKCFRIRNGAVLGMKCIQDVEIVKDLKQDGKNYASWRSKNFIE